LNLVQYNSISFSSGSAPFGGVAANTLYEKLSHENANFAIHNH
jgi:hypothetical protein